MKYKTNGLIIREQSIGEQDKLVTALTASNGIIRAFVRGAKNIKSQKCAATQLLCYSNLTVNQTPKSLTISDAKSIEAFIKLRESVEDMCLAQYFCQLAEALCPREQEAGDFLRLTLNSLYMLANRLHPSAVIKACCEMRLMSLAGYMPDLTMCSSCGAYEKEPMCFLPGESRLLCADCAAESDETVIIPLSRGALTALRHTIYAEDRRLFSFTLSDEDLKQLNSASEAYIKITLEKDFSTLKFYKNICKY